MSGLITARPASRAAAIWLADQSAQCASPVMTSSSTHESISVADRMAAGSVIAQQGHDVVSAQAGHVTAAGRVTQPPGQTLSTGWPCLGAHDLQVTVDFNDLDVVTCVQSVLSSQLRRDGHLALAVQHHGALLLGLVSYY